MAGDGDGDGEYVRSQFEQVPNDGMGGREKGDEQERGDHGYILNLMPTLSLRAIGLLLERPPIMAESVETPLSRAQEAYKYECLERGYQICPPPP